MKILLFLVAVISVVAGQVPKPCVAPKLWEARMAQIDPSKRFFERARISYDAINQRTRIVEEVNVFIVKEYFDILYLADVGKEYRVNLKTKRCTVRDLTEPFRPFEVPPNATFYGESYIGNGAAPGEGVLISLWGGELREPRGARYMGSFTNTGCLPVEDGFFSERTGFIHTTFYDVVAGIVDPNVFIPPRECA